MAAVGGMLPILDKLSLNNEIVLLRRVVKKAKSHVISKISREIKALKQEKSWQTETIKLKNHAKVQRLTDELRVTKTLNNDDISKMALLNETKEFLEVIRDPAVTTKEKLTAKIACDKAFAASVAKVLTNYLPITNTDLTTLVENLGTRAKKSKNKLVVPTTPNGGNNQTSEESDEQEICTKRKQTSVRNAFKGSEASYDELKAEEALVCNDKEELVIPTTKEKKKRKLTISKCGDPLSDTLETEKVLDSDENGELQISIKKKHKLRHTVIEDCGVNSDELGAKEAQCKGNNELGITKTKKKKHKHTPAKDVAASADELETAEELDIDENGKLGVSTKKKHKSRHSINNDSEVFSDEFEVEKSLDCKGNKELGILKKKKKKHRHAVVRDAAASSDELETTEVLDSDENLRISTNKKPKSRHSSKKDCEAYSGLLEAEEELDNFKEGTYNSSKTEKNSHKKDRKLTKSNTIAETMLVKKRETEILDKCSTKAIRFSELLKMDVESLQSNVVETQTSAIKEVDPFFVSVDGKSQFMTTVISETPEVVQATKNNKYDEMRQQYLNDFGYVPNRAQLRKQERQGVESLNLTFKSFHNLPTTLTTVEDKIKQKDGASEHLPARAKKPFPIKPRFADVPVHPSWEAKRKEKEMLSVTFQGTKIKFD